MVKQATWLLCAVGLSSMIVAQPLDIIVESRREGKNFLLYRDTGPWEDTNKPPDVAKSHAPGLTGWQNCGSRKLLWSRPMSSPCFARFSPGLTVPAHLHVYATWSRTAMCEPVVYSIRHARGEESRFVSQSGWGNKYQNCDRWIHLGEFDFVPGSEQYVQLEPGPLCRAMDRNTIPQVSSDSVRFRTEPLLGEKEWMEYAAPTLETGDSPGRAAGASASVPSSPALAVVSPNSSAGFSAASQPLLAQPAVNADSHDIDIVIESGTGGQHHELYTDSGGWADSASGAAHEKSEAPGLTASARCGSRKRVYSAQAPQDYRARFVLEVKAPAHLYVYTTWCRAANAGPVAYTVRHSQGEDTKLVKQYGGGTMPGRTPNSNCWVPLGDYTFSAGPGQYVELHPAFDSGGVDSTRVAQAYADAVRFTSNPLKEGVLEPAN